MMRVEPACWSWPAPPPTTPQEELDRLVAEDAALPVNERVGRGCIEMALEDWGSHLLLRFQQNRCAICGRPPRGNGFVEDHDHATGLVRGYLCRGCNVSEGMSSRPLLARYRERNPASILDVQVYYSGHGWPYGWWEDINLARKLTNNPAWVRVAETGD